MYLEIIFWAETAVAPKSRLPLVARGARVPLKGSGNTRQRVKRATWSNGLGGSSQMMEFHLKPNWWKSLWRRWAGIPKAIEVWGDFTTPGPSLWSSPPPPPTRPGGDKESCIRKQILELAVYSFTSRVIKYRFVGEYRL